MFSDVLKNHKKNSLLFLGLTEWNFINKFVEKVTEKCKTKRTIEKCKYESNIKTLV